MTNANRQRDVLAYTQALEYLFMNAHILGCWNAKTPFDHVLTQIIRSTSNVKRFKR